MLPAPPIFHIIVAFGRLGEICGEYLTKGRLCYVEGSIRSGKWEDGNERKSYDIVARYMRMCRPPTATVQKAKLGTLAPHLRRQQRIARSNTKTARKMRFPSRASNVPSGELKKETARLVPVPSQI